MKIPIYSMLLSLCLLTVYFSEVRGEKCTMQVDEKLEALDNKLEELTLLLQKHMARTDELLLLLLNDTSTTTTTTTATTTTTKTTSTKGAGLSLVNTGPTKNPQMFVLKKGDQNIVPTNKNGDGELNIDNAVRLMNYLKKYELPASFDHLSLRECGGYPFGFIINSYTPVMAPCFYVKLNKISGWVPKPIDEENLSDIPLDLADHWHAQRDKNNVWIHCDGTQPADKEAIRDIQYFPASRAIPVKYFPFTGESLNNIYRFPPVAIKIHPGKIEQLVNVECRAYAKDKIEAVQFGLLIKE